MLRAATLTGLLGYQTGFLPCAVIRFEVATPVDMDKSFVSLAATGSCSTVVGTADGAGDRLFGVFGVVSNGDTYRQVARWLPYPLKRSLLVVPVSIAAYPA